MESQALALLCGLSSISFTAHARKPFPVIAWLLGFFVVLNGLNPRLPWMPSDLSIAVAPSQIALIVVMLAFVLLKQPALRTQSASFGGALAAVWVAALVSQGYGLLLSLSFVICISLVSFVCLFKLPKFSTPLLQEEAHLIVLVSALGLAIVPEVINSWSSAFNLQTSEIAESSDTMGPSVLLIVGGFVILGVLYTSWKRR